MLNQITNSLNFQSDALRLRSERQRLLASNIANADTPGYVAKDFDFSAVLRQATGQASSAQSLLNLASPGRSTLSMAGTSGGHLQRNGQLAGDRSEPELSYSVQAMTNLDNNTVDMDRERANFTDNTVRYEATLRFINSQVKTLNTAITGQ
jgi:flagellar basal-body rod protein FlgB